MTVAGLTKDAQQTLREIFSDILGLAPLQVTDTLSPDDCEQWDSLTHLKLVAAIEQELDVELSPEEQAEMLSFELSVATVLRKR